MQRWPHKMLNLNKVSHNIVRDIFEEHPSTHVSLIYQHPRCTFARDHHRGENDPIINVLWITYLDKKTSYLLPNLVPAFHYLLLTPWNTWWICSLAKIFLTGTPVSNLMWKYQNCYIAKIEADWITEIFCHLQIILPKLCPNVNSELSILGRWAYGTGSLDILSAPPQQDCPCIIISTPEVLRFETKKWLDTGGMKMSTWWLVLSAYQSHLKYPQKRPLPHSDSAPL